MTENKECVFKGNLTGLGFFTKELVHLVSLGEKESIKEVLDHVEKQNIVEYLSSKYGGTLFELFSNMIYDNKCINNFFKESVDLDDNQIKESYLLSSDNDGLLLLLAVVANHLEKLCRE